MTDLQQHRFLLCKSMHERVTPKQTVLLHLQRLRDIKAGYGVKEKQHLHYISVWK